MTTIVVSTVYDEGQGVVITAQFRDSSLELADPDDVFFEWIDPAGLEHFSEHGDPAGDPTVIRDDEGEYHVTHTMEAGRTKVRWQAVSADPDGPNTVSDTYVLCADASDFGGVMEGVMRFVLLAAAVYVVIVLLLLVTNHGAHRKPTPDPLDDFEKEFNGG